MGRRKNRGNNRQQRGKRGGNYRQQSQERQYAQKRMMKKVLGVVGLKNEGNTCYFNSVMQNVMHSSKLLEYYNVGAPEIVDDESGERYSQSGHSKMSNILYQMAHSMWSEKGKSGNMNPSPLLNKVRSKFSVFRGNGQHDAHELLRCLLDGVLMDETINLRAIHEGDSEFDAMNENYIAKIFQGSMVSSIVCHHCAEKSITKENFMDLSLPIEIQRKVNRNANNNFNYAKKNNNQNRANANQNNKQNMSRKARRKLEKKQKQQRAAEMRRKNESAIELTKLVTDENSDENSFDENTFENTKSDITVIDNPTEDNDKGTYLGQESDNDNSDNIIQRTTSSNPFAALDDYDDENDEIIGNSNTYDLIGDDNDYGEGSNDENYSDFIDDNIDEVDPMDSDEKYSGFFTEITELDNLKEMTITSIDMREENISVTKDSIYNCLFQFTHAEILDGDNTYGCYSCTRNAMIQGNLNISGLAEKYSSEEVQYKNMHPDAPTGEISKYEAFPSRPKLLRRAATKQYLISSQPPILTIHLKRFEATSRQLNKISKYIEYPEELDLTPFLTPEARDGNNYRYRLYGISVHQGNIRGGHYVAYVKRMTGDEDDGWYYFSDTHFYKVDEGEVMTREAYVLFYERYEI